MKVMITGATGYVGKTIVKLLVEQDHDVFCLVRKGSEIKLGKLANQVTIVTGDITDPSTINLNNCDAVIHLVAVLFEKPSKGITYEKINYESAKNVIDSAKEQGVKRFLYMSAAGGPPLFFQGYYANKLLTEEYLKSSGLDWTILKPALIYDKSWLGKSMGWVKYFLWVFDLGACLPVVGKAFEKWKPISKKEIAEVYLNVLENEQTIGEILMGKALFKVL